MSRFIDSKLASSARRASVVGAAALALALAAATSAQAFGGPGAGGGPGMHGGIAGPQTIESIKTKLNLNTSQQVQFDQAAANGKAAREAGRAEWLKAREAVRAELAKAEPDLAAIAAIRDAARAKNQGLQQAARADWLAVYATFNPEQKAVVKEFMTQRLDRAEGFRHKLREGMRYRGG
jgi:Spy/CpxP family protein refolding chaperone